MRKTTTAMMIIMIVTVDRGFLAMAGSTPLVDIVVVTSPSSLIVLTLLVGAVVCSVVVPAASVVGTGVVVIGSVVGRVVEVDTEVKRMVGVGVTEEVKNTPVKVVKLSKVEVVVVSIPVVGIEEESIGGTVADALVKVGRNWSD